MQPIDYTQGFQPVNIAGNIGAGFQVGAGIQNELQRRQDEQIARQQAEQKQIAAMRRQAEYERDVFGVFNDPTPQNIARLQITYPERIKEFQAGFDTLDKARVADEQAFIGKTYAALRTNPAVAEKLLSERIAALTNAGEDAAEEKQALDLLKTDPKQALGYVGSMVAFTLPKDQVEALAKLQGEQRAEALAPAELAAKQAEATIKGVEAAAAPAKTAAELRKIDSEIRNLSSQAADRAARLNLDRDRLLLDTQTKLAEIKNTAGKLPDSALKIVNEAVPAAIASQQAASQLDDLATKLEAVNGGFGRATTFGEYFRRETGNQDAVTALRQEYVRLRSQQAIKSLPPGPATDRDIELALKGFPPETADSKYIASFLRGTAKLQRIDAAAQEAKSEWVQANGSLGNARDAATVSGLPVSSGESFTEFSKRFVERAVPPESVNPAPSNPNPAASGFKLVRVRPQ